MPTLLALVIPYSGNPKIRYDTVFSFDPLAHFVAHMLLPLSGLLAWVKPRMTLIALVISTTNLAACVCVSSKFDKFLPARFYFVSKRPENFVRIVKFPYAAFGPLFAFHCPLFVTKNNNLGWHRHASPHTGTCRCNDHGPTVLSARGQ